MPNYDVTPFGGFQLGQGISNIFAGAERGQQKRTQKREQKRLDEIFSDEQSQKNMSDSMLKFLTGEETAEEVTAKRADWLVKQGKDPSDTLAFAQMNPEDQQRRAKGALLRLNPQAYQTLYPKERAPKASDIPSSVRETQWFLEQPKDVQDKHIELKRKSDPTMAAKLEQKKKESDIKVDEAERLVTTKSIAGRNQGYIDSGVEAADSLSNINKTLSLLGSVKTGGFDNAALKAKQFFGIESANEAELSAGLGKAILSQLKPIFGAAFTAAEGDRLERIEANFGKSTAGNVALLKDVKRITERAARRGLRAAKKSGDQFTVDEIKKALDSLDAIDDIAAESKQSKAEPAPDQNFQGQDLEAYQWATDPANAGKPQVQAILSKLGVK